MMSSLRGKGWPPPAAMFFQRRDEAADEQSLGDCEVFAAVCDARRDGWIASMEAALSALSLGSVAA